MVGRISCVSSRKFHTSNSTGSGMLLITACSY
ncbi:hypothetical protein NECAME_16019 [Necator americanus]|uniref:Uncharacterized protein n=1 Tax=Necator americanus TaxID=51031 RepID=W2TYN7_NECAM|nr:hypothetical protein NECAME_16019 [Necator americanus]ETN86968.1 hypothetical protein NECAME_16019 [Necator americanus]